MKRLAVFALLVTMSAAFQAQAAPLPGGSLSPTLIPKYTDPLPIPPPMPATAANTYSVAARQFQQQVLPASFARTTVWGYGSTSDPASFSYPARTIIATQGSPTTVTWRNELVANGSYLPHLFTIDPTLH
ncbi:MAG: hypothetical protein ACJ79R_03570, partial [Anaeromyxobacteraceae bacterium]